RLTRPRGIHTISKCLISAESRRSDWKAGFRKKPGKYGKSISHTSLLSEKVRRINRDGKGCSGTLAKTRGSDRKIVSHASKSDMQGLTRRLRYFRFKTKRNQASSGTYQSLLVSVWKNSIEIRLELGTLE